MATRLYTPPGTAAAVSPAFSAEWESVTDAVRRGLSLSKFNGTDEYNSVTPAVSSSNLDVLIFQFVSPAIAAGPLAGTFIGQFYADEFDPAFNLRSQAIVKLVSNDGATLRGVLYAGDLTTLTGDPAGEWPDAGFYNRTFPRGAPVALSTVNAQINDRVVVEIGYRQHSVPLTSASIAISDDTSIGDLPSGDSFDAPNSPPSRATWVEFSNDLFTTRIAPAMRTSILE
jgi:hypothetical protein